MKTIQKRKSENITQKKNSIQQILKTRPLRTACDKQNNR